MKNKHGKLPWRLTGIRTRRARRAAAVYIAMAAASVAVSMAQAAAIASHTEGNPAIRALALADLMTKTVIGVKTISDARSAAQGQI